MARRLRILVVCYAVPKPDRSAGDLRLFEIMTLLGRRHAVDLYVFLPGNPGDPSPELSEDDESYRHQYRKIGVILLGGREYPLGRIMFHRRYDVFLFEFWYTASWMVELFRQAQPWAKMIIDTVDVHFLREESGLKLGISEPGVVEENKRNELASYRQADALIVITPEDKGALEACEGMPRLFLIPIIVPVKSRGHRLRGKEALFVGGFKHYPNVDGILWFVTEVWPSIRAESPDATITVVGSHVPASVEDLRRVEGVDVVGYVPRTEPYLERAAVSVAPVRFGGGMKGKVVEAMASGLAVVTTSTGAQGLGAISGRHLIVADEPEEFARSVVELLADPDRAEDIGRAGGELVAATCSPEAVGLKLEEMLAEVVDRGRATVPPPRWLLRAAKYKILSWKLLPSSSSPARRPEGLRGENARNQAPAANIID
jgi:glycosyltransferase involved in cell wall biosynthesis